LQRATVQIERDGRLFLSTEEILTKMVSGLFILLGVVMTVLRFVQSEALLNP